MRYIKALVAVLAVLALIILGIQNTQPYTLSFLFFCLKFPVPLWTMLIAAFFLGMLPIIIVGLPEKYDHLKRMRAARIKNRQLEKSLRSLT